MRSENLPSIYEVFRPNGIPTITYVPRKHGEYENRIKGILRKGFIAFVHGPSKCGKTVLSEKIAEEWGDMLHTIPSRNFSSSEECFHDLALQLGIPTQKVSQDASTQGRKVSWMSRIKASIFSLGEVGLDASTEQSSLDQKTIIVTNPTDVKREIAKSKHVFLLDNFHYIKDIDVKREILNELRHMVEHEAISVIIIAITDNSDYLQNISRELLGRCEALSIEDWDNDELNEIPFKGFSALGINENPYLYQELTMQCFRSPAIMQTICLQLAIHLEIELKPPLKRQLFSEKVKDALPTIFRYATHPFSMRSVYQGLLSLANNLPSGKTFTLLPDHSRNRKEEKEASIFECLIHLISYSNEETSIKDLKILQKKHILEGLDQLDDKDWIQLLNELSAASELQLDDDEVKNTIETSVIKWKPRKKLVSIQDPYFAFYVRWSGYVEGIY